MSRILVIDDEPLVLELIRTMLVMEGYEVFVAPDGKKGLKLFSEHPADLIITDLIMPEMEGIETISTFRRDFPKVKIIAMSGGGRNDPNIYLGLAENLGADCTFSKPFDRKAFLEAVKRLLASS